MRLSLHTLGVLALVAGLVLSGVGATVGAAGASSQETDCSYPVVATDATGTEVVIEEEPQRVVTLAPSAAQTMWEIGATEKVVAVTKHANYLEGAKAKGNISGAGYTTIVSEKVVAQEPDLVLAPNIVDNATVEKLRESGLTVYYFPGATSLEDVKQKTQRIGALTGECEGAQERVDEMDATISLIREAVADEPKPRVLYHLGTGYTAGSETFIDAIIRTAGGTNLAADAGIASYREISSETVVAEDPQFIVHPSNARGADLPPAWNTTTAVQEDNVVVVRDDYMNQPAPRTVEALETMVKAFHPEAYQEALEAQQTTTTTTDTTETTRTDTTESTTTATTEETTGADTTTTETPGVGVLGVGIALLLVSLIRRYR
jgi:iron complex transport system substrate-binding protein